MVQPKDAGYANNAGSFLFSVTNAFKHGYPGWSTVPYYTFNNAYYGPTFGAGNDWYVHSQLTFGTCRPGYTYQCRIGALDSTNATWTSAAPEWLGVLHPRRARGVGSLVIGRHRRARKRSRSGSRPCSHE